ncbi:hypothetical protein QBC40DRAFT_270784 [Triangularia verruculosa]|uniref:Uncharacterized protein n=1 Tax=Triangularia verruculosa TaxID=2587418 RepID=A0AAN6XSG5_9PEZI|nr:hypothetical protein QBC40DRAFT_270784 [Triangularia verruculosa]
MVRRGARVLSQLFWVSGTVRFWSLRYLFCTVRCCFCGKFPSVATASLGGNYVMVLSRLFFMIWLHCWARQGRWHLR